MSTIQAFVKKQIEQIFSLHHKSESSSRNNTEKLLSFLLTQIKNGSVETPFGMREQLYMDWIASGQSLMFLEKYIFDYVFPYYANTHTNTSYTGFFSTSLREEARNIIKYSLNANTSRGTDKDCLIFTGSGMTGAVNQLIRILRLNQFTQELPESKKPIVFIGPYEHHSNILPWRHSIAQVVTVPEDQYGQVDEVALEKMLKFYADRKVLKIGSFSAASNVTGILTNVNSITALLHKYEALAFWDYACCGPYVKIDMNPLSTSPNLDYRKDAVFISVHKFLGGPQTPGILMVKKKLFNRELPPTSPAGGTVTFVTEISQDYNRNPEVREEGGTPDISFLTKYKFTQWEQFAQALFFILKKAYDLDYIREKLDDFWNRAVQFLKKVPEVSIVGPTSLPKLPILSFLIRHRSGRYLHYNFVSKLMNDLFGIQTRGGCSCAGPASIRWLGISEEDTKLLNHYLVTEDIEVLRPGYTRLFFHYVNSEKDFRFTLRAIQWIAQNGFNLLPLYNFDPETGSWYHISQKKGPNTFYLNQISFENGTVQTNIESLPHGITRNGCFEFADSLAKKTLKQFQKKQIDDIHPLLEKFEKLRFFVYPWECFHTSNEWKSPYKIRTYPDLKTDSNRQIDLKSEFQICLEPHPKLNNGKCSFIRRPELMENALGVLTSHFLAYFWGTPLESKLQNFLYYVKPGKTS